MGTGLWYSVPATLLVEGLLFATGIWIYIATTRAKTEWGASPSGRHGGSRRPLRHGLRAPPPSQHEANRHHGHSRGGGSSLGPRGGRTAPRVKDDGRAVGDRGLRTFTEHADAQARTDSYSHRLEGSHPWGLWDRQANPLRPRPSRHSLAQFRPGPLGDLIGTLTISRTRRMIIQMVTSDFRVRSVEIQFPGLNAQESRQKRRNEPDSTLSTLAASTLFTLRGTALFISLILMENEDPRRRDPPVSPCRMTRASSSPCCKLSRKKVRPRPTRDRGLRQTSVLSTVPKYVAI